MTSSNLHMGGRARGGAWRLLSVVVAAALVLSLHDPTRGSSIRREAAPALTEAASVGRLIGQKLMVAMAGTTPSASLLGRVERGEIGGVLLYGSNISSAKQLAALTRQLRDAAAAGGQPDLLIATDQEGGLVKRVAWAAPTLSPPQMGAIGRASAAYRQGRSTGVVLACAGINHDLAPVADVPSSTSSFMYQQGRTWSFDASLTATLSDAFANGLGAGNGLATMKHFPGIGMATLNTDSHVVTITASRARLAPGLQPYAAAISHDIPLIMLSNATYTAYDTANAAGWSRAISIGLLRNTMGFTGVSITDSLSGIAAARGVSPTSLAVKAATAGTDMIMLTGSELSSAATYASLVNAAQNGTIPLFRLRDSYARILAMKSAMTIPAPDTTAPEVAGPSSSLFTGSTLGSTSTPVSNAWLAIDPCGISQYVLERQTDSGEFVGQALSPRTLTSLPQSLRFGSTYRYRVRAMDGAGNSSALVPTSAFKPRKTEQANSHVIYRGGWRTGYSTNASGGSVAYSTAANARADFSFTGFAVSWVAYRGPDRGRAAVYVDGVYQATVNLYSPTSSARQVVFAKRWTSSGAHTMRVVNLGTTGHSRVDVDAFVQLLGI